MARVREREWQNRKILVTNILNMHATLHTLNPPLQTVLIKAHPHNMGWEGMEMRTKGA